VAARRTIVVVPARLGSSRLPGKALAPVLGKPLIIWAWENAVAADVGPVIVATEAPEIAAVISAHGGRAALSGRSHFCGTDRVAELVSMVDPGGVYDAVVNFQGDIVSLPKTAVAAALALLDDDRVDIGTLAAPLQPERAEDPNVVKIVATALSSDRVRALYFTRARAPWGEGAYLAHSGVYAFRRNRLEDFAARPPSPLERRERLEQLRALEAGWRIDAALLDKAAASVDTKEDLEPPGVAALLREEK
jgi:3-deoxy-manno-octulosonate cytidylyltransferase (CMP-KDO synthetase)